MVKSNISARIAFKTASKKETQIILDEPKAERVVEDETFLYRKPGEAKLITGYVAQVELDEIQRVVDYLG